MSNRIPVEIEEIQLNPDKNKIPTFISQWHLLVSSNVRTDSALVANEVSDSLKSSVKYTFEERSRDFIKVLRPGDEYNSRTVEKIKISYASEIGEDPKGGRVHLHAVVEVKHHTILQLDYKILAGIIKEHLQDDPHIKGPFVSIKWFPNSRYANERYIGKNPLTKERGYVPIEQKGE